MQRMSRMKPSVTVARTQPLTLVPHTRSVSMRIELRKTSKSVRKKTLGIDPELGAVHFGRPPSSRRAFIIKLTPLIGAASNCLY